MDVFPARKAAAATKSNGDARLPRQGEHGLDTLRCVLMLEALGLAYFSRCLCECVLRPVLG